MEAIGIGINNKNIHILCDSSFNPKFTPSGETTHIHDTQIDATDTIGKIIEISFKAPLGAFLSFFA